MLEPKSELLETVKGHVTTEELKVRKRDGSLEPLDIEKINVVVSWAVDGIKDVNVSDIVINARLNFKNGILTTDIHKVLIESAVNLFNEDSPNYQWVASRLLNYQLRKDVWGGKNPPKLFDLLHTNINLGLYDSDILDKYTESEINKLDEKILHDRDFDFTYSGLKQLCTKYLVQNRKTKQIFETPQFVYMIISMIAFSDYPSSTRITYVKKAYDAFSKHKINLPTPLLSGVRTPLKSYASCMLLNVDDTMDSITTSWQLVGKAVANRFGIGINIGKLRPIGSEIRGGEVLSTGLIPFLKVFESVVRSCHQNGIRGGSATVNVPIWHSEIEDVLVLKNNGGTEDNRVRKLDYVIHLSKIFYQRFLDNKDITLFSPHEAVGLYESFGTTNFDPLYEKYEKSTSLKFKKKINARELFSLLVKERTETGRIYIMNIDHCNDHSSFQDKIDMTNLCVEVTQPTTPLQYEMDSRGEIGVCTLAAINVLTIKDDKDLESTCDITVRMLEELMDKQVYFNPAAQKFVTNRRSLGIGLTNLAAYLARHGYKYTDEETPIFVDILAEKLQYYLLKSSLQLSKEKGPCPGFSSTKYALGILPIDTYKKDIDVIVPRAPSMDWEGLRKDILKFGLRHSTLTAQMPVESSSVSQNATNGVEPVRKLLTFKGSKSSSLPLLVPEHKKWKYTLAFEMGSNTPLINIYAVLQKWMDMSLSANTYYKYADYENGKLPDMVILKDILYAYKMGLKTLYYSNTSDEITKPKEDDCAGGACTL